MPFLMVCCLHSSSERCYEASSPTDTSESSCDELSEEEDGLSLSFSSASSAEDCVEADSISECNSPPHHYTRHPR